MRKATLFSGRGAEQDEKQSLMDMLRVAWNAEFLGAFWGLRTGGFSAGFLSEGYFGCAHRLVGWGRFEP